jgi:hypothetical protein
MFEFISKVGVRHESGYEVERIDRYLLQYRSASLEINLDCEVDEVGGEIVYVISSTQFEGRAIKSEILIERVRAALAFGGELLEISE